MRTTNTYATALPVPVVPLGINPHYETENRMVWNEEKYTSEEHEFVYEVLGVWRWFLRTHRKA